MIKRKGSGFHLVSTPGALFLHPVLSWTLGIHKWRAWLATVTPQLLSNVEEPCQRTIVTAGLMAVCHVVANLWANPRLDSVQLWKVRCSARSQHRRSHPWQGHVKETWQARLQDSRDSLGLSHPWQGHVERPDEQGRSGLKGPLDQLEHLPQSRNLSVLLFYAFHQLFWH